ncbi:MAG: endonuclease/exonuclease/phosphatase family protein [Planctomycetaceae bacterium]
MSTSLNSSPSETESTAATDEDRTIRRSNWLIRSVSAVNVIFVASVYYLIHVVSESHYVGVILTYFPRMPYLIPSACLCVLIWRRSKVLAAVNLLALFWVLGPVMEFHWNSSQATTSASAPLKVISCNVQGYAPDFSDLMNELVTLRPDILVLQESGAEHDLLQSAYPPETWHRVSYHEFRIISRYPVELRAEKCITMKIGKWPYCSAICAKVDGPGGEFYLFNIHQLTPRHELAQLSLSSIWNGTAGQQIAIRHKTRDDEAAQIRQYVERLRKDKPFLIAGDFNTPSSSSFFRKHWGDLSNAFDVAGKGYGYTANCDTKSNWPRGFPWSRVDHILTSAHWQIDRCRVGSSNGSDHRLMMAELLQESSTPVVDEPSATP